MTQENGPATGCNSGEGQDETKQTLSLSNLDPRQALPIHPAAKKIRPLTEEEYAALVAHIDEHGLLDPIEVMATSDGYQVIEGVHRQRACLDLGELLRFREVAPKDPYDYAMTRNASRRHFSSADKHEMIANQLMRDPNQSDQVVATTKSAPATRPLPRCGQS
jgi:hypothetical protein